GIYFEDGPQIIGEIALGRDNTGSFGDRTAGCHTFQFTRDDIDFTSDAAIAAATWTTIGNAGDHQSPVDSGLRRLYEFPQVNARAIRVITTIGNAIDEIELYEGEIPPVVGDSLFRRGDADGSGGVDITDAISSLGFLFGGTFVPGCLDALDWDDNGDVQITDPIATLTRLFSGGDPAAAPGSDTCGPDPTDDDLENCVQTACQ
ncbi:MAG: hypothetical protein L0206_25420, partial [Actinobacteria bacterium]|nr:hypothetical protein [Actinomycetota bacterium]